MKPFSLLSLFFFFFTVLSLFVAAKDASEVSSVIRKDTRKEVAVTEYGQINAVEIRDQSTRGGHYHLQFFTLEPNSLFLPVILHADMVFYVHTGSGSLNWLYEEKMNKMKVRRGDVYRLHSGSVFYLQSSLESTREKLRVYTIFSTPSDENPKQMFSSTVYSSIADMVLGFDTEVLQAAFLVGKEVAEEIKQTVKPPPIVHVPSNNRTDEMNWTGRIIQAFLEDGPFKLNGKKSKQKKNRAFNILDETPDVKNCYGWSTAMNSKKFKELEGSEVGVFVVNLTQGSMMGPHWNPRASEIAIVTHGQGMIQVVCPSSLNETRKCKSRRFVVKEGDVFYVPRFHPMAQMAFNNGIFVFMGFSTMERENYPQFLAGKNSVIRTLDRNILAISFNVSNKTMDQLVSSQVDSTILECLSCAEEEERIMWEEIERQRQEEEKKKEEEEAKEREKEEEEKRKKEEEAREKEEEEKRKKEEEEARRKQQEEEAKQREKEEEEERQREWEKEEARREREEEEARQREWEKQEAQRKREEEEARQREHKKEEARREREEEEARQREWEKQEAQRKREEEEARQREWEKEEAQREREEEKARQREREEEEARRREWEKEAGGGGKSKRG